MLDQFNNILAKNMGKSKYATFACFYLMRTVRLIQLEHLPSNVECRRVWSRYQLCFEQLVQVKLLARTLGPSLELSHSQDVRQLSHPACPAKSFTRTNTSGTSTSQVTSSSHFWGILWVWANPIICHPSYIMSKAISLPSLIKKGFV